MIVKVLQEDFAKTLAITSRFASTKVQLPVLANVLLSASKNKLLVSATNLEISVSLTIGAKTQGEGEITIPARVLTDLISNLRPGQVTLRGDNEQLSVSTEDSQSVISGINSRDFPKVPQKLDGSAMAVSSASFRDALGKVLFAVSVDETRPILTGALVIFDKEKLTFVATDGFRLSQKRINLKSEAEGTVIIPKNALAELTRLTGDKDTLEASINKAESQILFRIGDGVLASRTIEGEFPPFEKIIPKTATTKISLDKEEFLRAVKLASVFARDSANVVKLGIKNEGLELYSESQKSGTQKGKIDAKVEKEGSEDLIIAFNYKFIEDFLNVAEGEEIRMEFTDPNAPGVFVDRKDADFLHIIMPVRI